MSSTVHFSLLGFRSCKSTVFWMAERFTWKKCRRNLLRIFDSFRQGSVKQATKDLKQTEIKWYYSNSACKLSFVATVLYGPIYLFFHGLKAKLQARLNVGKFINSHLKPLQWRRLPPIWRSQLMRINGFIRENQEIRYVGSLKLQMKYMQATNC